MSDLCFTRSRTKTQIRPQPETTCKIEVACCKQGKIRKSGEWLEEFYRNKTGVPHWYTNYGKSAIAAANNFELMLTNNFELMLTNNFELMLTKVHKIVRISRTNRDNPNL